MKQNEFKRKPCLLNLTHNENSSKNINISINYNLGSPKVPQSIKGKKIDRMIYPLEEKGDRSSLKQNISGCEVSVKLIRKKQTIGTQQKSLIKSRTGILQKPKRKMEVDFPMSTTSKNNRERRLFTDYEDHKLIREQKPKFSKSIDHIRVKSQPKVRTQSDVYKKIKQKQQKPLSQQKPKRQKIKSSIFERNKTEIDLKDKQKMKKRKDKQREKEKEKDREKQRQSLKQISIKPTKRYKKKQDTILIAKKSKKLPKRRFFSHMDFQPLLISKILNSSVISDQIQSSQLNSKQQSERKPLSHLGDTVNVFKNTNSIQLVPINQIRKFQKQARLKVYSDQVNKRFQYDKAATLIKKVWKQYHTKTIIKYYNSVFQKNSKEDFGEDFSEIKDLDQIQQSGIRNLKNFNQEQIQQNQYQITDIFKKCNKYQSPSQEQEDAYFDINKYQQMVKKTLEQDHRQKQAQSRDSSKVNSRTNSPLFVKSKMEGSPQQLEQWNNINKLLNNQFNKVSTSVESNALLNQLMKQSEMNRKWIQEGSPQSMKQSLNNLESNQRIQFHSKTYDYDQGISSRIEELMNMQLMNNSQSQQNIIRGNYARTQEIDSYLDCGLDVCGLNNIGNNNQEEEQINHRDKQRQKRNNTNHLSLIQEQNQQSQSPGTLFGQNHKILPQSSQPMSDLSYQSMDRYNAHSIFQQFYNSLIDQVCDEIHKKSKVQKVCKRYMRKIVAQLQSKYSIKTSHQNIKQYVSGLVQYVLSLPDQRAITLRNINCTLGPSSKQMLYYLRIDDYDTMEEEEEKEQSLFVISLDTFQRYQQILEQQQRVPSKQQMYQHFWHRALFEGLNEALDQHRPYGTYGKPYDWQVVAKLKGSSILNENLQTHLKLSIEKLLQISSYMGGVIVQKQDSPFFGVALSEDDYQQINQERVSRILADQLMQQQESWINYSDQKVQVQLQIIELIQQSILMEIGRDLKKIQLRRAFTSDS